MSENLMHQFIGNFAILVIRYFVLCGIFFGIFYFLFRKLVGKHKLQDKHPLPNDHLRDILYSISSSLIFAIVFTLTVTVFLPFTKIYESISDYSRGYYWLSYVFMFAMHDTYFYWTHRLIHTKHLFRYVHLVHHKSTNPSPWTSYAFHPFEAFVQSLIIPILAISFPIHFFALTFYFLFQFFHNIYGHLGYELLPAFVRESWIGRQLNTSIIHNKHHKDVKGNYGLYLTVWDRIMGTLKK